MRIHDISVSISESLAIWPGDPRIRITQPLHLENGDLATVSRLDLGAHTGTHVDAPAHFVNAGSTVDRLDLDALLGPAEVVEALDVETLSADSLARLSIPSGAERVIFHTRNSDMWEQRTFHEDFVSITPDGATWLIDRRIRLVGVDGLSAAPFDDPAPTHRALLRADIVLVEGLDLRGIAAGTYYLVCLPLKIRGIEGAPARAILIGQ